MIFNHRGVLMVFSFVMREKFGRYQIKPGDRPGGTRQDFQFNLAAWKTKITQLCFPSKINGST